MKTTEQLRNQVSQKIASTAILGAFEAVLQAMDDHHLEATDVSLINLKLCTVLVFEWISTFNLGNIITLTISDDGTMLGIATSGSSVKVWTIDGHAKKHSSLRLSMAETMEYIRHFIWANHNV